MITKQDLLNNQKASNTNNAYEKNWRIFEAWAQQVGVTPLPCSKESLQDFYLNKKKKKKYKFSTINQYIVAINHYHKKAGFRDLISSEIKDNIEAIKRILAFQSAKTGIPIVRHASVLERSQYENIIRNIDMYNSLEARNKAIFAISYAAGLRVSEVLALTFADVTIKTLNRQRTMFVSIRKSKTDQKASGQIVKISAFEDKALCPIVAFENWQRHTNRTSGYLFVGFKKNGKEKDNNEPITRQHEDRLVKRYFGKGFSPHSFRSSNVTHASDRGATIQEIMKTTRHSHPNSVLIYLDVRMMDSSGADYLAKD